MATAKVFMNGRSQAVQLPKGFCFDCDEVIIRKLGEMVVLVPKDKARQTLFEGLGGFSDDFMENGRPEFIPSEREEL